MTTALAEGQGFEPWVSCPTHAFQACRFGRSRTPPGADDRTRRPAALGRSGELVADRRLEVVGIIGPVAVDLEARTRQLEAAFRAPRADRLVRLTDLVIGALVHRDRRLAHRQVAAVDRARPLERPRDLDAEPRREPAAALGLVDRDVVAGLQPLRADELPHRVERRDDRVAHLAD